MKKFVLAVLSIFVLIFPNAVYSSEIEDDYLDIAANYCILGEYDNAMGYLDKILEINPQNALASDLKKGLSHVIAKDKKTYITSVNPDIKRAQEYKRIGDTNGEFDALVSGTKSENSYLAYYYLGNFYRDRNQYKDAIDAYNKSLSARADFSQAYLALAVTLFDNGHYESSLNPLDKYLVYNTEDDFAYAIKSRSEFQLGLIEAAEVDNNKALELNSCPEYLFDKAKILYKTGEYAKSKELFSKLNSDFQTSKLYEYMGLCDYAMKNYMSALDNVNKALVLSQNDEYLENMYNEIKALITGENNE